MSTYRKTSSGGFIKLILLIVIALVVLGFFGYDIRDILSAPKVQDNLTYVWGLVVKIWNNFLAEPTQWVWEKISDLISKS